MELDRDLPGKIPDEHLVIDKKTGVSLSVLKRSQRLIGNNNQEQSGGRVVENMRHDFYKNLHIDPVDYEKPPSGY